MNAASHCEILLKLQSAIQRKLQGLLTTGVLLHHDNEHVALSAQEKIDQLEWLLLQHPPYSPNLVPNDFSPIHEISPYTFYEC